MNAIASIRSGTPPPFGAGSSELLAALASAGAGFRRDDHRQLGDRRRPRRRRVRAARGDPRREHRPPRQRLSGGERTRPDRLHPRQGGHDRARERPADDHRHPPRARAGGRPADDRRRGSASDPELRPAGPRPLARRRGDDSDARPRGVGGGALLATGQNGSFYRVVFYANQANSGGGGIYINGDTTGPRRSNSTSAGS